MQMRDIYLAQGLKWFGVATSGRLYGDFEVLKNAVLTGDAEAVVSHGEGGGSLIVMRRSLPPESWPLSGRIRWIVC